MKCTIYTLKDLEDTGLPIFDSCISPDVKVGERFLQSMVLSRWDFNDYDDFYTYFEGESTIKSIVNLCVKTDEKTTKFEHLKKDLSNIYKNPELLVKPTQPTK